MTEQIPFDAGPQRRLWLTVLPLIAFLALAAPFWLRLGDGRSAIEWGVYGVPETFIVGREGRIVFKLVGPVTPGNIDTVLKAEIEKAAKLEMRALFTALTRKVTRFHIEAEERALNNVLR